MPISSVMLSRRWLSTSKVTGSIRARVSGIAASFIADGDVGVAESVDARALASQDHDRGARMLDDSRAVDFGARGQGWPTEYRRGHHRFLARTIGLAGGYWRDRAVAPRFFPWRFVHHAHSIDTIVDYLDAGIGQAGTRTEKPFIFTLERLSHLFEGRTVDDR